MGDPATPQSTTSLAVAIADGASLDSAQPHITATGRGAVAEQIIAIAHAHGVRVREDADLAEVLAALDIDSPIPLEALSTVAGILTYVYRARSATESAL